LNGCFDLSDSIVVRKEFVVGGSLSGGPFSICIDNESDFLSPILNGATGRFSQWIVTDATSRILDLPNDISEYDFDDGTLESVSIWHLSYGDSTIQIEEGMTLGQLSGCLDLSSNFLVVQKRNDGRGCNDGTGVAIINEILGGGLVELGNAGDGPIDLSEYFLCDFPDYERIGDLSIDCGGDDYILNSGELLTVEFDDINIDGIDGELGLYRIDSFASTNAIVDYVEWGTTGHTRSSVAVGAGIWSVGSVAETFTESQSLVYDGNGDTPSDWAAMLPSPCDRNAIGGIVDDWEIFGNPTTQFITVIINSLTDKNTVDLEIRSVHGDLVQKLSRSLDKSRNEVQLDVSELPDGMYLIIVRGQATKRIDKFIKQ